MFADPFHETRFGAQDHERRGQRPAIGAHERLPRSAMQQRRAQVHAPAPRRRKAAPNLPQPSPARQPSQQARHVAGAGARLQPAYAGPAQAHAAPRAAAHPQVRAAHRSHQPPKHHMPYIHARHLARIHYQQELKHYHLALRQWRHLLVVRQHLLTKLSSLERRLARQAQHPPKRQLSGMVYEIDGAWYAQTGRKRRILHVS